MKKNEVKISENGVKYYVNENGVKVVLWEGEKYTFYPFVDCDPEMQNQVIAYLKETQPALLEDTYFFYEVFLPIYQVRLRVVSDNKDEYMDMYDSQNIPILFETKRWLVTCAIKDFFYSNVKKVKSPTYYKEYDILDDIEDWMKAAGLKDEWDAVSDVDANLPFDIISRLPW